jgi:hypothetical protein
MLDHAVTIANFILLLLVFYQLQQSAHERLRRFRKLEDDIAVLQALVDERKGS